MFEPGEVLSYQQMCLEEGLSLQRGMNFRPKNGSGHSIFLMNQQSNAKYPDRVEENGQILIYEGHDIPNLKDGPEPKTVDQPEHLPSGQLTENGKFKKIVTDYKAGKTRPELIRVYEKIKKGLWVYNGLFSLIDAWQEEQESRKVFKYKLEVSDIEPVAVRNHELEHNRMIPSHVKVEVWKRDKGKCIECGAQDNLHFDHILPFSKGGTSLTAQNIQLLCARHNLSKRDKIQ